MSIINNFIKFQIQHNKNLNFNCLQVINYAVYLKENGLSLYQSFYVLEVSNVLLSYISLS